MDEKTDGTGARQARGSRAGILLAAVVMVIAATVGVLVSSPDDLHVFGGTLGRASTAWPVGQPVYVSLSVIPEDNREDDGVPENDPPLLARVFVRTASVVIARNDAKATVSLLRCRTHHPNHHLFMNRRRVEKYCKAMSPVEIGGYRFGVSRSDSLDDELVLAITPRRHGTVRTDGVHLVYDQDGDRGDERVGNEVTIRAK